MAVTRDVALRIIGEVEGFQRELAKLPGFTEKEAAKMAKNLGKELIKAEKQAGKTAKASASAWSKAFSKITLAVSFADVKAAAHAVFELADFTSAYVDKTLIMASTTGLAAETVVGLEFAAARGGASVRDLEAGLARLTKSAGDSAKGSATAAKAFKRVGVDATTTEGGVRDMDAVLRDVLDSLGEIEDPTARATAAIDLFGARGSKIVEVLGASRVNLDHYTEAAREAGIVMDEEARVASAEMDRALAELDLQVKGLTFTLGKEFAPEVVGIIDLTADLVQGWAKLRESAQGMQTVLGFLNPSVTAYRLAQHLLADEVQVTSEIIGDQGKALEDVEGQTAAAAAAAKRLAEEEKAAAAAAKAWAAEQKRIAADRAKALEAEEAAAESLADLVGDLQMQQADAYAVVNEEHEERLRLIQELEEASGDTASAEMARAESAQILVRDLRKVEEEAEDAREAAGKKWDDDSDARAKKRAEEAAAWRDAWVDAADASFTATTDLALEALGVEREGREETLAAMVADYEATQEDMTAAERRAAEARIEEARDAAEEAWRIDQALRIAQAVAATATAIIRAYSDLGWPGGIPASIAASVIGTGAVASIAAESPSFHGGGVVGWDQGQGGPGLAPDERLAKVRTGEAVFTASQQRALGGMLQGRQDLTITYGHRSFERFRVDRDRAAGRVARPSPVGHSRRRRT